MNRARLPVVLACGAIICTLAGCEFSASTASVGTAVLARGYTGGAATGVTTAFRPSDRTLHCVVTLNNAPDGTTVKVAWVAVSVGRQHNDTIDSTTVTTANGENIANFQISLPRAWPTGTYKAVIYLNNTLDRTLQFRIR